MPAGGKGTGGRPIWGAPTTMGSIRGGENMASKETTHLGASFPYHDRQAFHGQDQQEAIYSVPLDVSLCVA